MGRHAEGWRIRAREGRPATVRFRLNGQRYEFGLSSADPSEARREAARIYAETVRGQREPKRRRDAAPESRPLAEVFERWLSASQGQLRAATREGYRDYSRLLALALPTLADCTTQAISVYRDVRLGEVLASTVRKELSALRGALEFAHQQGWLAEPVVLPPVGRVEGTRATVRRRVAADELSPEEVAAFLAALPEWSTSRKVEAFPVRARFVVAYETSLRPATLDQLSVPEHYQRAQAWISIPPELDKRRQGRRVPLTPAARAALDAVAPDAGLIFGAHDYRDHVRTAAAAALPPEKASRFTGQHLRSARISHLLEATGNLLGVMRLAGHTQIATTSRYTRAPDRAAEAVIAAVSAPKGRGSGAA